MKTRFKLSIVVSGLIAAMGVSMATGQSTAGLAQPPTNTAPAGMGRGGHGPGVGGQPRMENALLSLQEAKRFLEAAAPDKGGNREKAIKDVDDAIAEVKAGMEYAKAHPEEFGGNGRGGRGPAAVRSAATK